MFFDPIWYIFKLRARNNLKGEIRWKSEIKLSNSEHGVDVYYNEDLDYEKDSYGTLCIYDYITETNYAELTKKDREALASYKK